MSVVSARAVVVGVPHTTVERLPPIPTVSGDARGVAKLLRGRGVHVDEFSDGLTVEEFSAALVRLRDATAPGDLAVVYFSGHGYQLPDNDGDEWDDTWDECLVLSNDVIRNDWFRKHFWPDTQSDTRWITCVDACFSASIVRWLDKPKPPTVPQRTVAPARGSWRIDLAAAPDGEQALQLTKESGGFGEAMAWMTAEILACLKAAPDASYRELWSVVQQRAKGLYVGGWVVPMPQLTAATTDDRLVDSRAFSALDW